MFKTDNRNGFTITFANGYTVSVQWHELSHCSNRALGEGPSDPWFDGHVPFECENAEVAIYNEDDGGCVQTFEWCVPQKLARIISIVSDKNYSGQIIGNNWEVSDETCM